MIPYKTIDKWQNTDGCAICQNCILLGKYNIPPILRRLSKTRNQIQMQQLRAWLLLACDLRPNDQDPVHDTLHIGERMRGCPSAAMLRICNMIELVHAKKTHTYAAARRLSGMPRGPQRLSYVDVLSVQDLFEPPAKGSRVPSLKYFFLFLSLSLSLLHTQTWQTMQTGSTAEPTPHLHMTHSAALESGCLEATLTQVHCILSGSPTL